MSYFDGRIRHTKTNEVDFIVNDRLIEAREIRGMSQETAARLIGLSQSQLGLWENGHQELPLEMLFLFMKVYNFPRKFFYQERWERV